MADETPKPKPVSFGESIQLALLRALNHKQWLAQGKKAP